MVSYYNINTANGNSYCNTNLSSNEYRVLWESGRIFISIFLYEHICICTSVNTGYIIYLPNKRAEEKINHWSTKNGIIIQIERKKCNLYIKYGNEILKYYTYVIKKILTGRRKVGWKSKEKTKRQENSLLQK